MHGGRKFLSPVVYLHSDGPFDPVEDIGGEQFQLFGGIHDLRDGFLLQFFRQLILIFDKAFSGQVQEA